MNLTPPSSVSGIKLELLHRQYAELQAHEAWKDFASRIAARRAALINDLLKPRIMRADRSLTDTHLRTLLMAIDMVLDIPMQISNTHADMRAQEALKERIKRGAHREDLPL